MQQSEQILKIQEVQKVVFQKTCFCICICYFYIRNGMINFVCTSESTPTQTAEMTASAKT